MMKVHDIMFLLAEILFVILRVLYYICEAVYKLFVPRGKKSVAGEIVLITGAGHGIGKELAIGYASLGATVICWDINQENNEHTMKEIKEMGISSVYAYRCDVADREEVFKMAKKVREEVGDVTILVNNAGISHCRALKNYSPDEIRRTMDVNLIAHYSTLKAFLPSMIEKNHGHVVAVASGAALHGFPNATIYCASKSAVRALMEAIHEETRMYSKGKSSVKFTTVLPSLVSTGLCKQPRSRFPIFLKPLSAQKAASQIIDAQRQNFREKIIDATGCMNILNVLKRYLPDKAGMCAIDFLDIGFDADD